MSYFHLKSKPTMPLVYILDRHHIWRSLDPTLDTWSNFVKKAFCLFFCLFIQKDATFDKDASFLSAQVIRPHPVYPSRLSAQFIHPGYLPGLSTRVICRGYPLGLFIQLSDASQSD